MSLERPDCVVYLNIHTHNCELINCIDICIYIYIYINMSIYIYIVMYLFLY